MRTQPLAYALTMIAAAALPLAAAASIVPQQGPRTPTVTTVTSPTPSVATSAETAMSPPGASAQSPQVVRFDVKVYKKAEGWQQVWDFFSTPTPLFSMHAQGETGKPLVFSTSTKTAYAASLTHSQIMLSAGAVSAEAPSAGAPAVTEVETGTTLVLTPTKVADNKVFYQLSLDRTVLDSLQDVSTGSAGSKIHVPLVRDAHQAMALSTPEGKTETLDIAGVLVKVMAKTQP